MVKLIVRIDDVHERMNWDNFEFFTDLLLSRGLTAILGVVPKCEDKKLIVSESAGGFWQRIESLEMAGFKISQHGFRHVYDSNGTTILLGNTLPDTQSDLLSTSTHDRYVLSVPT